MIPESFLEQLKYASPIESVIEGYVTLKRAGRTMKGLCPFHSEKSPSFVVYTDNQSYYCFGCGNGGDVITFIRNIENLEYIEAVKFLAARAGMTVPEDGVSDKAARLKSRVLELNRASARFFHEQLKTEAGRPGLDYLLGRGLAPGTIKRFGLGYSPDSWDSLRNHLRAGGFTEEEMLAAAVIRQSGKGGYDAFRGRVMFPIIDLRGNVIAFGGRAMGDSGPKYLNSADTPVFKKSRGLFALNLAKNTKSDTLVLAEGYMDVIAIHQAGFDNAVATLGTALTAEQARLISQYAKRVAIAYDSDEAGQKATARAINLLGELDVAVSVLEIPGAKDPDEYIKKFGKERFGNLIEGGKGAIRFELDKLKARCDLGSDEGKGEFLREFCRMMAGIHSEIQRETYVSAVARDLGVGAEALRNTIAGLRKKSRLQEEKKSAHDLRIFTQDKADRKRRTPGSEGNQGSVAEEQLILLLMKNPDQYEAVKGKIAPEEFQSEDLKAIFAAIMAELEANRIPEMMYLSGALGNERMARLTRLIAEREKLPYYPGQALEYAETIKSRKDKRAITEIGAMSNDEAARFAASLAAGKKK